MVDPDTLANLVRTAFESAGVRADIAETTARGLIWTSLRGIDSHGVRLVPHYIEGVRHGRINPCPVLRFEQNAPGCGVVDADHGPGHAAGDHAMKQAVALARTAGIAAVVVRNSSHCGAMSWYAHEAASQDMVGLAFTHATSRVLTPGSTRPFFGNNPICMVAPMDGEDPFCFDAATTGITFNKVRELEARGEEVPPGLVADSDGNPTTVASLATQLLPIGGYKGYGLSMMVDIICALLTGMPSGDMVSKMFGSPMSEKRLLGHMFCAINISSFVPAPEFKSRLAELAARVRSEPTMNESSRVMVPGDPEKQAWRWRVKNGVPLAESDYRAIMELQ